MDQEGIPNQEQQPEENSEGESGAKNPGRTEEDELHERIELTYRLLSDRMRKSDIKAALKAEYGVCARTAENYLSRAREIQLQEYREEREVHAGGALAFYSRIAGDQTNTVAQRINAQREIDKLLGLAVPARLSVTMSGGSSTKPDELEMLLKKATPEELAVLRGLYERTAERDHSAE